MKEIIILKMNTDIVACLDKVPSKIELTSIFNTYKGTMKLTQANSTTIDKFVNILQENGVVEIYHGCKISLVKFDLLELVG